MFTYVNTCMMGSVIKVEIPNRGTVFVVFEELVGKKIRIIQKDGFQKIGHLEEVREDFLILLFEGEKLSYVRIDCIASVEEVAR
jgi:hypothetical protein